MKMKLNKKIIVCINLVIIVMISGICAIAHEISESERIEVIFSENSIFTEDEKHLIESSFSEYYDVNKSVPYGLTCTLFGHDYKSEIVNIISHKVYAESPRCVEEAYNTKICTRCSDTQSTLLSHMRIDCCK